MEWAFRTRDGVCRRKNLRIEVQPSIPVLLRSERGDFSGELQDISLGGARIQSDNVPTSVGRLKVSHEAAEDIPAAVRWTAGRVMGVSFEQGAPAVGLLTRCLRRLVPLPRT